MSDLGGRSYLPETPATDTERTWGIIAHLSPIVGSVIGIAPAGPLIVWLLKKEESPYIAKQAKEALAFSILAFGVALLLGAGIFIGMCLMGLGLLLVPVMAVEVVAYIVYMIVATMNASEGKIYEYPVSSKYVR